MANNLGNVLGKLGEQAAALAAYDAAIALHPRFAPARLNRAITLDQIGRHDEARAEMSALAGVAAPTVETLVAAASVERNSGDLPGAAARLDDALALAPAHAAARRVRARLALDMGDADAGERHRAALADNPRDRDLQLSYLAAAESREARRDAVARLETALAADPRWLEGHRALAGALWEAGQRDGYKASYETALAETPNDVLLWQGYVSAVGATGDFAAAAAVCERAEAATGAAGFAVAAFEYHGAAGHRRGGRDPGAAAGRRGAAACPSQAPPAPPRPRGGRTAPRDSN